MSCHNNFTNPERLRTHNDSVLNALTQCKITRRTRREFICPVVGEFTMPTTRLRQHVCTSCEMATVVAVGRRIFKYMFRKDEYCRIENDSKNIEYFAKYRFLTFQNDFQVSSYCCQVLRVSLLWADAQTNEWHGIIINKHLRDDTQLGPEIVNSVRGTPPRITRHSRSRFI